jgi:hypothetical protein
MLKVDFSLIPYKEVICWGLGNHAVGLNCIASFKIGEQTEAQTEEEKKDYEEAKRIYDEYINKGQKFFPTNGNKEIISRITFLNFETGSVSWKQCNLVEYVEKHGESFITPLKPAKGKFSINAMIYLFKSQELTPIE